MDSRRRLDGETSGEYIAKYQNCEEEEKTFASKKSSRYCECFFRETYEKELARIFLYLFRAQSRN